MFIPYSSSCSFFSRLLRRFLFLKKYFLALVVLFQLHGFFFDSRHSIHIPLLITFCCFIQQRVPFLNRFIFSFHFKVFVFRIHYLPRPVVSIFEERSLFRAAVGIRCAKAGSRDDPSRPLICLFVEFCVCECVCVCYPQSKPTKRKREKVVTFRNTNDLSHRNKYIWLTTAVRGLTFFEI